MKDSHKPARSTCKLAAQFWGISLFPLLLGGCIMQARAATDVSGTITATNWTKVGSPYNVVGHLLVAGLTIQPGVQVRFQGDYVMEVVGKLIAVGSSNEPIVFTCAQGGWQGIYFNNCPPGSVMTYCVVSCAVHSGVRVYRSAVRFDHCQFINNSSPDYGGGLYAWEVSDDVIVEHCDFLNNRAGWHGGGAAVSTGSRRLVMRDCVLLQNTANPDRGDGYRVGGGLALWGRAEFLRCTVQDNTAYSVIHGSFGQQVIADGGGMRIYGSATFDNCTIYRNTVGAFNHGTRCGTTIARGAGVYVTGGSLDVRNSMIWGNTLYTYDEEGVCSPQRRGAALYLDSASGSLVNVTCGYNTAGIAIDGANGSIWVTNSIVYGNSAGQIAQSISGGSVTVAYSDVEGGFAGTGNIAYHPVFGYGSWDIVPGSPCIDAGDPNPVFNDVCCPPSFGPSQGYTLRNDMGWNGGPGACYRDPNGVAPSIEAQPRNQSSCLGHDASFSVAASGSPPLYFQWLHNNVTLPTQTGTSLALTNLVVADGGVYSVVVSNVYGSVTSAPAALVVHDACANIQMYAGLTITGQPGQTYVLKCTSDAGNTNFATWTPLATNTLTSTTWAYIDMDSPFQPRCIYGVKLLP